MRAPETHDEPGLTVPARRRMMGNAGYAKTSHAVSMLAHGATRGFQRHLWRHPRRRPRLFKALFDGDTVGNTSFGDFDRYFSQQHVVEDKPSHRKLAAPNVVRMRGSGYQLWTMPQIERHLLIACSPHLHRRGPANRQIFDVLIGIPLKKTGAPSAVLEAGGPKPRPLWKTADAPVCDWPKTTSTVFLSELGRGHLYVFHHVWKA